MNEPIRYLVDEHVPKAVVHGLRKRGINVITIADAGLLGAIDEDLLGFAKEQNLIMMTQDRDFLRLDSALEGDHAGIVYAPQGRSIGELVRLLDLLVQVSSPEEMRGRVEYI